MINQNESINNIKVMSIFIRGLLNILIIIISLTFSYCSNKNDIPSDVDIIKDYQNHKLQIENIKNLFENLQYLKSISQLIYSYNNDYNSITNPGYNNYEITIDFIEKDTLKNDNQFKRIIFQIPSNYYFNEIGFLNNLKNNKINFDSIEKKTRYALINFQNYMFQNKYDFDGIIEIMQFLIDNKYYSLSKDVNQNEIRLNFNYFKGILFVKEDFKPIVRGYIKKIQDNIYLYFDKGFL